MILFKLQKRLESTSADYFRNGLDLFQKSKDSEDSSFQAALGNISIAIELLLKTLISKKCPKYLFTNLPLEIELKLTYPTSFLPLDAAQERDLNDFFFKSEQFNKCISIFYVLFPELKKELQPYFKFISEVRNSAVHSVLPNFQRIDLDRSTYLLLLLSRRLIFEKIISQSQFKLTDKELNFLKCYDQQRIERIKKKIENSTIEAKKLNKPVLMLMEEDWQERKTKCPVCQSDAYLIGYCEFEYEKTYDGADTFLTFFSEAFECEACKLKLFDREELSYAGIELTKDLREYIPIYLGEKGYSNDEFMDE